MISRIFLLCLMVTIASRGFSATPNDVDLTALTIRAKATLHEVMEQEETWIKIHAAEGLIVGGDGAEIRERFLKLVPTVDTRIYRVGIWRVLANTAPTPTDRAEYVKQVEAIFLNPKSTDRSQAIETLCKLHHHVTGPMLELVREIGRDEKAPLHLLALWSLCIASEPGALERLCVYLRSTDAAQRTATAYALRWLHEKDPTALRALADAADAEAEGTSAYAYLLSAAFALNADPARRPAWRGGLERVLATGSMESRFEACNGLATQVKLADLPQYVPLLDGPGNDTRVGAAMTILYVRTHE